MPGGANLRNCDLARTLADRCGRNGCGQITTMQARTSFLRLRWHAICYVAPPRSQDV
jgi:hypothetical protein